MREQNIQQKIRLAISKHTKSIMFRNNVGTAWTGLKKSTRDGGIYIENPRPFHAGLGVGSSDLIGWTEREITPDMVGKKIAIFTALEIKTKNGKATKQQLNFLNRVRESGGIAGIATDDSESINILNNYEV